jgi:hypothetical protein
MAEGAVRKLAVVIVLPSTLPIAQTNVFFTPGVTVDPEVYVFGGLQNSAVKLTLMLLIVAPVSFLISAPIAMMFEPEANMPKARSDALAAP